MKIVSGVQPSPYRDWILGDNEAGKSSYGASIPNAVYFCAEESADKLNINRATNDDGTPIKNLDDFFMALKWLAEQDHSFESIVIDTVEGVDAWVIQAVMSEFSWNAATYDKYDQGEKAAVHKWRSIIARMERLQQLKKMNITLLGQTSIERIRPLGADPYDRYVSALPKGPRTLLQDWVQNIFCIVRKVSVDKKVGTEQKRILHCQDSPFAKAKNKIGLPPVIAFEERGVHEYLNTQRNLQPHAVLVDQYKGKLPEERVAKASAYVRDDHAPWAAFTIAKNQLESEIAKNANA